AAEGVVVPELRAALEPRHAQFHMDRHEVERLADERARQLAGEDRLQRLEPGAAAHLLGPHIARRGKPRAHRLLFRPPAREGVFGHKTPRASSCRSFRIPESSKPAGANLRSNRTRLATRPAVYRSFGRAALAASNTTS